MTRLAEALRRTQSAESRSPDLSNAVEDERDPGLPAAAAVEPVNVPSAGATVLPAGEDAPRRVFNEFNPAVAGKLVVSTDMPAAAVEQYRQLGAALHHLQVARDISVVMVASAVTGEGKTLTATNLALTFSHSYRRRVLLVDADLRRPALHQVFRVPNVAGLNDGLKTAEEQKLSLIQISDNLTLLPAGRPEPDPMSGLTSDRMRRVIREAAARFDWVVIDTPPLGLLPDAHLLAAMVDVALLVIRAGKSPFRAVQRAIDAVGRDRVAGIVLNAVDERAGVPAYTGGEYLRRGRGWRRLATNPHEEMG